jgi:fluoride exporter
VIRLLFICLGGAIGTGARYLLAGWSARQFGTGFPYGTLLVNLIGSFLLGFLMGLGTTWSPTLRLALTTGVMGGFTTYSTFNYETTAYVRDGAWLLAFSNVALTLILCFAGGLLGIGAARLAFGRG